MFGLWNIFSPYSQRKTNTLSLMKVYFPTETLDENIFPRCFSFSFNLFQFWRKSIIRLCREVEFWFLFFVFVVKSIKTFNKSLVNVVWEVFENTFLKTFLIKGWMNFFWEEVERESEDEQMKKYFNYCCELNWGWKFIGVLRWNSVHIKHPFPLICHLTRLTSEFEPIFLEAEKCHTG